MAPQISQIWVRMSYLLLLNHCEKVISHQVNLLASLSQPFYFLQAAGRVIDLSILSKDGCLPHHFLDVLVNGEDAVEYLSWTFSAETGLAFNSILIFLGLLLCLLESPLDPR